MQPVPQVLEVESVGSAAGSVATMSRYDAAPVTGDQLKVGKVRIPVAPLVVVSRLGAGKPGSVIKLRIEPGTVLPPAPFAKIRK